MDILKEISREEVVRILHSRIIHNELNKEFIHIFYTEYRFNCQRRRRDGYTSINFFRPF